VKRLAQVVLILAMSLLTLGADLDRARFEKVGHELMCTCGCQQVLLECNHVGCQVSDKMRAQVAAAIQSGGSDESILQSFVDQFGPTVLAAPTKTGFDRVAWITPWAIFALGLFAAILFVRKWQGRQRSTAAASVPPEVFDQYVAQARKETEL
jgi:cytochrome c-type biogenesis protein CcmH/NrfF